MFPPFLHSDQGNDAEDPVDVLNCMNPGTIRLISASGNSDLLIRKRPDQRPLGQNAMNQRLSDSYDPRLLMLCHANSPQYVSAAAAVIAYLVRFRNK